MEADTKIILNTQQAKTTILFTTSYHFTFLIYMKCNFSPHLSPLFLLLPSFILFIPSFIIFFKQASTSCCKFHFFNTGLDVIHSVMVCLCPWLDFMFTILISKLCIKQKDPHFTCDHHKIYFTIYLLFWHTFVPGQCLSLYFFFPFHHLRQRLLHCIHSLISA